MKRKISTGIKPPAYDPGVWEKQAMAGRQMFIRDFFLIASEIPGWKLLKSSVLALSADRKITTYMCGKDDTEDALVRIDLTETPSWHKAHEALSARLDEFGVCPSPHVGENGKTWGDICFAGPHDDVCMALFSHANVVAGVHSVGYEAVSVSGLAQIIDALLVQKPSVSSGDEAPRIEVFSGLKGKEGADGAVMLRISAHDPRGGHLRYQLYADSGEFFAMDENIYYKSEPAEDRAITLFVTSEAGLTTAARLSLSIR